MSTTYADRKFGITTTLDGSLTSGIVVNNLNFTDAAETAEGRNEKGQIINIAAFSKKTDVSCDGLWVGTTGIPVGTKVTLGSKQYLVTNVGRTEANTAFQTANLSLTTADNAVLSSIIDVQGE